MVKLKTLKMTCKGCGEIVIAQTLSKNPPKERIFECNDCVWERWQKKWAPEKIKKNQLVLW